MGVVLRTRILGRPWGDFRPGSPSRAVFLERIANARVHALPSGLGRIFAPRAGFTNRVASFGDLSDQDVWNELLIRTRAEADAGVVTGADRPVAFFSGDCPLVCLYEGERLAVLHAGYRCLIRESDAEPSIIESALTHFDADRTRAWVGFGIGPCCWVPGYATKPEVLDPSLSHERGVLEHCLSRTTRSSPFGPGQVSVDLIRLARTLLERAGIPESQIEVDRRCTCCAFEDGDFPFWSLTRAKARGGPDGRNCAMAWLERQP